MSGRTEGGRWRTISAVKLGAQRAKSRQPRAPLLRNQALGGACFAEAANLPARGEDNDGGGGYAAALSFPRLCGALKSSSGPTGTIPVGLIVLWLP